MACTAGAVLDFDFSMAFQPIVDSRTGEVFSQEALVRGLNNEPASEVFAQVNDDNLYRFDQVCRVKAIKLAADLGVSTFLNVNFMRMPSTGPSCASARRSSHQTFRFSHRPHHFRGSPKVGK